MTITRIESPHKARNQVESGEQAGVALDGFSTKDVPTNPRGQLNAIDHGALRGVQLIGR